MVIVVGPAETAESVRELNFRHEFEIEEIHGSGVSTVLHQLEQGAEHITHLVYDVRIIGNIDASLALLDRLCKTIPGISEKTIVVAANLGENSPFLRDICELVPQDHVVQDPAAELKRVLNTMLCADGIIRAEAEPEPQEAPVAAAAEPVPEPQEPPPPPAPIEVTPPSQVGRTAAQAQLVLPKPKIERSATCIAVAGAGHRIGATTQAMQICLYVKALGYKAAVIEMAASALTGYTQISDEAVLFDEHHFRVEGTDIYNDRTCILDGKSQYDYLILDYGCFSDLTEPADYLRNDILVAVCGAKPSEVELAADVLRVDNGTIHYIFSFVPQRDRPDVLLLTNVLVASDKVIIPVQTQFFATQGLSALESVIRNVRMTLNPGLEIAGVLFTFRDRTSVSEAVTESLREQYAGAVFQTEISRRQEAINSTMMGKPATGDIGREYAALADELTAMEE